ncbi:MAG: DNA-3-methyladenine glycosylase 2 family protein [Thaumarchaeota archaeon]|nr:DNA-3-methyladenine glycosylase 2 family protein [Nitrososphaerota archaeon]
MKSSAASIGNPRVFRRGYDHVRSKDKRLARVMDKHGVIKFKAEGELFESLVESILSQQLSGASAGSIIRKVRALYPDGRLEARAMHGTPARKLRSAGVSPQKLGYLKDLSSKVAKNEIDLEALRSMDDDEIINILDAIKGIGPWTVHMLLIFTLGRADVFPVDDLGIRKGVQAVYSLKELPKKDQMERLAETWRPYRSVASLYLWRQEDE